MFLPKLQTAALTLLVLALTGAGGGVLTYRAVAAGPSAGGEKKYAREIYQDFRGKKPLVEQLILVGGDHLAVCQPEEAGLRIALPTKRFSNDPIGVCLRGALAGDFEITARYQFLSAGQPPGNAALGVAFNLVTHSDWAKFAKLGRFYRKAEGDVYIAECQRREEPVAEPVRVVPTEAKAGQLRLIRAGAKLRYLVADDPPEEFREIYAADYTAEDLEIVRLGVNNNGSPTGVEVRLVDLRIRHDHVLTARAEMLYRVPPGSLPPGTPLKEPVGIRVFETDAAAPGQAGHVRRATVSVETAPPGATAVPPGFAQPPENEGPPRRNLWWAIVVLGIVLIAWPLLALLAWLVRRRRSNTALDRVEEAVTRSPQPD